MPEISHFFGISIRMYYDDHNPPHFHAIYGGAEMMIGTLALAVIFKATFQFFMRRRQERKIINNIPLPPSKT